MYFPSSQVEINLVSNGDLAYKNNNVLYYGVYFSTSDGKYYANSPNDTVLIELIKPKPTTNNNEFQLYFDDPESIEGPDARFESYENELYSLITKAPKTPPIKPIANPIRKNTFKIPILLNPNVLSIAISLFFSLTKITKPEIMFIEATIIIKVRIKHMTFFSTLRALIKDEFLSIHDRE